MLDSVDSTVYSVRATISMLRKNSVESKQVKGSFDPSYLTKNLLLFAVNFKICLRNEFDFTFYVWHRSEEIS